MAGRVSSIMLKEWLLQYGLKLDTPADMTGEGLVDALSRCLTAAHFDFDEQKNILLQAPDYYCDTAFFEACISKVKLIERLQDERRAVLERHLARCRNGVSARRVPVPASEVARLRFVAAWPLKGEVFDIVDDMLLTMARAGYIESTPEALRDLRQGLGYYRPAEDTVRLRAPVRWLRKQNALHWWISGLLGKRNGSPLIREAEGGAGCWVTAASLFADADGHAYTYDQLEHGRPSSDTQRQWLDSTIPLHPCGSMVIG